MTETASTDILRKGHYGLLLYGALIVAGLIGNAHPLPLLNVDFVCGSLFAMLALQIFGIGVRLAAAHAVYTYFAWNHPWGW